MYRDRDFDPEQELPLHEQALMQDMELNTLFQAMAAGDEFLFRMARQAVLTSLHDPEAIRYRQDILRDCLKNSAVVRAIYQIPIESMQNKRNRYLGIFGTSYPSSVLSGAVGMLEMFVELLRKLRKIADEHAASFESEGFRRFFAMIAQELDDDYFTVVEGHLKTLRFRNGVLLSAQLGQGNEGANYVLHKPRRTRRNWVRQALALRRPVYAFSIHPRDEHGARALSALRNRGINLVANAAAQSADHIDSFLKMLRIELAFYVGCLNLHEQLAQLGEPISFPLPVDSSQRKHSFTGLYDVCLALTMKRRVVGNDVNADGKDLVVITGANQGGKSTFLRSIGLAQLMMQCGMFVPAESFCANTCAGLFTHYRREEDTAMKSGKLDEELARMSIIVDQIVPDSMILFNESFAATNEREGSEIARQIVSALLKRRIKVFFVTHLYAFAHGAYNSKREGALFLRAERQADGRRTFRLSEGKPLQTSYGEDLYKAIFGGGIATDGKTDDGEAQVPEAEPLDRPTETAAGEAALDIVPAPGERWLNRNVVGMGITSFFSDAGHEAATSVLPAFLGTLGAPPIALGTIEGVADAAASTVKLGAGWISDRLGHRKPITVAGYALTGIAIASFSLALTWPMVLLGRLFGWLGRGVRGPLRDAMLAESVPAEARGKAFGFHRAGDTLGAIVGPLLAVGLLALLQPAATAHPSTPFRLIFAITLIPGLGAAVAFAALVSERRRAPQPGLPFWATVRALPGSYRRFLVGVGVFGAGDYAHTLLILAATQLLTPAYGLVRAAQIAALLYVAHNALYAGASYPIGALSDRLGRRGLLALGYLLGVVVSAGFVVAFALPLANIGYLLLLFALAGTYIAAEDALEGALTADLGGSAARGVAYGVMGTVNGVGDLAASVIVGLLWTVVSPAAGFIYAAAVMLAGAILVYRFR